MFKNQRFITCGIEKLLTLAEQATLWNELEKRIALMPNLDYLQTFETPKGIVWIIDDGTVTTMLLPDEY